MAQKSKKDRAKKNTTTLNNLHLVTLGINFLFLMFHLIWRKRSIYAYVVFSIPCLLAELILERTGRPKYDAMTKALKSSGQDLSSAGLTDFMFDVIFVTWISLIFVLFFGNWGWLFWATIPLYGCYKVFKLLGVARTMIGNTGLDEKSSSTGNRAQ